MGTYLGRDYGKVACRPDRGPLQMLLNMRISSRVGRGAMGSRAGRSWDFQAGCVYAAMWHIARGMKSRNVPLTIMVTPGRKVKKDEDIDRQAR